MEASNIKAMREALLMILGTVDHLQTRFDIPKSASEEISELKQIAESALSVAPRNCDRHECATTKSAQDVWRNEDGGKTAYYEWLLTEMRERAEELKSQCLKICGRETCDHNGDKCVCCARDVIGFIVSGDERKEEK